MYYCNFYFQRIKKIIYIVPDRINAEVRYENVSRAVSFSFEVLASLSISIIKWFRCNEMAVNPEKFQIMLLGCNNVKDSMDIDKCKITSTDNVKLLGITLNKKLNFNSHNEGICKKASQNISAFFRIRKYLDRDKAKLL